MSANIFNSVQLPNIGSNKFDLSHDLKLSFNMGELIPTTVLDCVPGDNFKINVQNMLRFSPLIAPVMHEVNCTTHYFFVPNRILWPEWEDWIVGASEVEPPYVAGWNGLQEGTVGDYLGMPIDTTTATLKMSAFPAAAYAKIYDDYYRDENLQTEIFTPLVAGDNSAENVFTTLIGQPKKRAWMHDYFTAALPWAQKGDPVQMPLTTGNVPVTALPWDVATAQPNILKKVSNGANMGAVNIESAGAGVIQGAADGTGYIDPNGMLEVDINALAVTMNTLRTNMRVQEWLEKNAVGGTRYIENIRAHFNVISSDKRLQRPEYIGGGRQRMSISEVLSTAQTLETDDVTVANPVGAMAGHGISTGGSNTFNYKVEEHGWIIGIINVQPVTAYYQGLHKMYSRETKEDYYWPSFANLGEQAVLNKELFAYGVAIENTFGYVPRYAEYKYLNSRVAGEFRSSLNYWTLARDFETVPALNSDFIECDPSRRIFAVTDPDVDTIYGHIYNVITAIRKMPKYGTPSF